MIKNILKKKEVKSFLDDVITEKNANDKIIPNTISEEKIEKKEYLLYLCLDAIFKFAIIVDSEKLLEVYLERLQRIIKKVDSHNELRLGIHKLIIKMCSIKLDIQNLTEYQNKKVIVEYIYDKYIVNGYFYHSFPSVFKDKILENGLQSNADYHNIGERKEISKIFHKYKIDNIFSKNMDDSGFLSITDSFLMASFYANNSPLYLKELCENIYSGTSKKFKKDAYVLKKYRDCYSNVEFVLKKNDMSIKEREKILNFLKKEWQELSIQDSVPSVAFIKRSFFNKNSLNNYSEIMNKLEDTDIYTCVSKILETKYNDEKIIDEVDKNSFFLIELPSVKSFYSNPLENEVLDNMDFSLEKEEMNEYGNATIVALFGVFLISMGITLMIIMMGK